MNCVRLLVVCCCLLSSQASASPYFSTHTPYELVRGDIGNVTWEEELEPVKIYFLARHGSRHLGESATTLMNTFVDDLMANAGASRFPWLETWERPVYQPDYQLVPQGMLEHYNIAKRYKARFPDLFPPYYPSSYSIRATEKLRTSQSAASFMFGLFENEGPVDDLATRTNITNFGFQPTAIQIESEDEDMLLRFMDNCPAYENSEITLSHKDYENIVTDIDKYKQIVLDPVSEVVGFSVDVDQVDGLYHLCAFEEVSPTESDFSSFCDMIPPTALELIEYKSCLGRYYASSYPNKLGYEISCVILEDLVEQFSVDPAVPTFRFAHSETIVPVITLLGLFKDVEILLDEYTDYTNMVFRLSEIDPFATNLVFIVFKDVSSNVEYIKVFLNEKEVTIPSCNSSSGCLLSELQDIIDTTPGSCNVTMMCNEEFPETEQVSTMSTRDEPAVTEEPIENNLLIDDFEEELLRNKLEENDIVVLNIYIFIGMVVLSALSVVSCGFICLNRARIFSRTEESYTQPMLSYQKMPFLD